MVMMSDIQRSWLRHWHSVLDNAFGKDPKFEFEAARKDPYGDFRMHFMTWDLSDSDLHRCFGVLPKGAEMCNRAIEMRTLVRSDKSPMSEQEAIELFRRGLGGYAQFVENEDLKKPIRVVRGTWAEIYPQPMMQTDRVAVVLEYVDWGMSTECQEAHHFLHETLYRLAHAYDVVDYVDWPLTPDPHSIDPHRGLALLAVTNEYYPALADGPVLFVVTDRVGK